MTEHLEAAIQAGADAISDDHWPDSPERDAERAITAAMPELRKHFTQDPEVRRAIVKALADQAEKETIDGIVGNIVPRTPLEAEQWLRAQLDPPAFPSIALERSMDGSVTTERVKSSHDEPLPADALPVDELNKKIGWGHE